MGFPGDRPGNEYDEAARFTLLVNRAAFRLPAHQPIVRFSRFAPVLGRLTVAGCEPEPMGKTLDWGILAGSVGPRVRLLRNALTARSIAASASYGLPTGSLTVLALIAANPGSSQSALAKRAGLNKSALVGIVDQLEAKGLAARARRVFLHLVDDELLVERAAVDADANRLVVIDRHLADGRELLVATLTGADVARVDAVLVERAGAVWITRQQQVAVVVEIADERRRAAGVEHALLDLGNGGRRLRKIDGDAHHLRPRLRELDALARGRLRIRRIGHRHRLDDDRGAAAHLHATDAHTNGLVKSYCRHSLNDSWWAS